MLLKTNLEISLAALKSIYTPSKLASKLAELIFNLNSNMLTVHLSPFLFAAFSDMFYENGGLLSILEIDAV